MPIVLPKALEAFTDVAPALWQVVAEPRERKGIYTKANRLHFIYGAPFGLTFAI